MEENSRIWYSKAFFTVTLSKDLLAKPIKSQLMKSYFLLHRILRILHMKYDMCFELTKTANIHYHGIITVAQGDEHLFNCFQDLLKCKYFGFFKVDIINKDNGTDQYIIKDIDRTINTLRRLKIDTDIYKTISNHETKLVKEKRMIPIVPIQTTVLDVLETIIEDEDYDHYLNYNMQLK